MFSSTSVDEIHIVFENCEAIEVPYSDIAYLSVYDIKMSLWDNNVLCDETFDYELSKSAGSVVIHLKNKEDYHRVLKYDDITGLYFYRHGNKVDYISIRWTEASSDCSNKGQKVEIKEGEIYIEIDEKI